MRCSGSVKPPKEGTRRISNGRRAEQRLDFRSWSVATLYEESGDRENSVRMTNAAIKRLPDSVSLQYSRCEFRIWSTIRIAEAKAPR